MIGDMGSGDLERRQRWIAAVAAVNETHWREAVNTTVRDGEIDDKLSQLSELGKELVVLRTVKAALGEFDRQDTIAREDLDRRRNLNAMRFLGTMRQIVDDVNTVDMDTEYNED